MKKFHFLFLAGLCALSACASRGTFDAGGVNPYLWRASLETLANVPIASTDSAGGVIITEWIETKSPKSSKRRRIKLSIAILTSDLRADGVQASVFLQEGASARWVNVPVNPNTRVAVEDLILTKARALRLGGARNE